MFKNILVASKFLRKLDPPDDDCKWEPDYAHNKPMIHDTLIDWYYTGKDWYPFREMAAESLKPYKR